MGILNLFRRSSKPALARRPQSYRPQIEALEDRLVQSATTYSVAGDLAGAVKFSVENKRLVESVSDSKGNFGPSTPVPGTANWNAWDVRAVQDSAKNIDMFVDGMDGHLWERTFNRQGKPLGGWVNMTPNTTIFAFDVAADTRGNVYVTILQGWTEIMWQATRDRNGQWSPYGAPHGTYRFHDVAIAIDAYNHLNVFGVGVNDHQVVWLEEFKPGNQWQVDGWEHLQPRKVDHVAAAFSGKVLYVSAWTGSSNDPKRAKDIMFNLQGTTGVFTGWAPPKDIIKSWF